MHISHNRTLQYAILVMVFVIGETGLFVHAETEQSDDSIAAEQRALEIMHGTGYRILRESPDFRLMFAEKSVLDDRKRQSVCAVFVVALNPPFAREISVGDSTTIKDVLSRVTPMGSKKRLIDVINRQPQVKFITKNAIYQIDLHTGVTEDFLNMIVHPGDMLFLPYLS